jgi:hypothetical protein
MTEAGEGVGGREVCGEVKIYSLNANLWWNTITKIISYNLQNDR